MPVEPTTDRASPGGTRTEAGKAAAGGCGDRAGSRNRVLRFPSEAEQGVGEWRNLERDRDLWADKISVFTSACTVQFAVGSVEIHSAAQEREELVLTGELPAIEIGVLKSLGHQRSWGQGANRCARGVLGLSYRSAKIGITSIEFDFVLGLGGDCHARDERSKSEELEEQRQQLRRA